ncbi:hypothetical protein CN374_25750 [Bacillus cereus]|nr:hypothetical protein CN374_25750 [Bacillus cereus]
MTFKTRELTVDLVDEISTKEIRFSQGDKNSAKLVLNITNQGQELDLSQAIAVRITFKKPDGTTVFQEDLQPINAMKGKYQIILKTQTLAAAGNVYGQVRIFEKDQELDAEPFGFTVRQSYSGDGAVESTTEFTIIQKALELGEKFKDVDFDPIIAAGELAKGAVKKSGDTMTGSLKLDRKAGIYRWIQWTTDNNIAFSLGMTSSETFMLQDTVGNQTIFSYNPTTKELIFPKGQTVTMAGETNLLKKIGDTMASHLGFQVSNGGKQIRGENGTESRSGFLLEDTGFRGYDWKNNREVFRYDAATNTFDIASTNTNVVTKKKDGRATLVLTADAENKDDLNIAPVADRRGNTVTVRMAIKRISATGSAVLTTLPVDMRPIGTMHNILTATDGTRARLQISNNGEITLLDVSGSAQNKEFYFNITYVVN